MTLWEAYREGIDDHRYVFTLETAIARARAAGHADAVGRAQAVIDQMATSLAVQPKYKDENLWSAEAFDAWRWSLAEQIVSLQKLLGE